MKKYVITISKNFPQTHPRSGEETRFEEYISTGIKKHTIRGNYEFWRKRFEQIHQEKARLVVRQWSGKPYRSKQIDLFTFEKSHGIGIEKIEITKHGILINDIDNDVSIKTLANNDGLNNKDFVDWFKKVFKELHKSFESSPMVIIHFTPFRYLNSKTEK